MGRCFAKHSMTSSKVCLSVRTGAIAGVFTYATSKQMLSMVGGSLNLRRLKFKAIRDGIPLWRKVFDLLNLDPSTHTVGKQQTQKIERKHLTSPFAQSISTILNFKQPMCSFSETNPKFAFWRAQMRRFSGTNWSAKPIDL